MARPGPVLSRLLAVVVALLAALTLVPVTAQPAVAVETTTVDIGLSWLPTRYLPLKQWRLHDATVYGDVYVFPVFGGALRSVRKVDYWIDSARPSSPLEKPTYSSKVAPYDMAGTAANREARPWKTSLSKDQAFHDVTMRVTYTDGTSVTTVARPYVSNSYRTINGETLARVLASGRTGNLVMPRGRYQAAEGVRGVPRTSLLSVTTDGGEVILDGGTLTLYPEQQHLLMRGRFHSRGSVNLRGAKDIQLDQWQFENPGLTAPAKAVRFTAHGDVWCDGCQLTNSFFADTFSDFLFVSGARNWTFSGNKGVRQYDFAGAAHFDGVQVSGNSTNGTISNNDLEAGVFVSDQAGPVANLAVAGGLAHKSTRAGFQTSHKEGSSMSGVSVDSAFTYGRNLPDGTFIDPATASGVTSSATAADPLPGHESEAYRIICGTGSSYAWFATQGTGTTATVGSDTGTRAPGMIRPLVVAVPGNTLVAPPAGFAEVARARDPSGIDLILYSKTIESRDPSVLTVSFGTAVPYAVATATYRWQHPTKPWVGTAGTAGADSSGPGGTPVATAPNVVPGDPHALVLRFFAAKGLGTWKPPNAYGRVRNNLPGSADGLGLLIFDPVYNDYRTPGATGVETAGFSGVGPVAGLTAALAPAPRR